MNRMKKTENCYLAATCSPQLQTHTLSVPLLHPHPVSDTESQHKSRATNQSGKDILLDLRIPVLLDI